MGLLSRLVDVNIRQKGVAEHLSGQKLEPFVVFGMNPNGDLNDEDKSPSGTYVSFDSVGAFNFLLQYPKKKKDNYHVSLNFNGLTSKIDAKNKKAMAEYVDGLGLDDSYWSRVHVTANGGHTMEIDHSTIPRNNQRMHAIEFLFVDKGKKAIPMSAFYKAAKLAYGLELNKKPYEPNMRDGPFSGMDRQNTGLFVVGSGGLKYGTWYEERAKKVIDELRRKRDKAGKPVLSKADINKLKEHDITLVEKMPMTHREKSTIIQKGGLVPSRKYVNLLNNIPNDVEGISVHVFDDVSAGVYCGYGNKPCAFSLNETSRNMKGIYRRIDHAWDVYSSLTGARIGAAYKALQRKFGQDIDELIEKKRAAKR